MIELLVVVAIIMLLAALLLPALRSAREKAKQIKCIANLKQMHLAFSMYAGDWNGYAPPCYYDVPGSGWEWNSILSGYFGKQQISYGAVRGIGVYICPSDLALHGWPRSLDPPSVDRDSISYGYNVYNVGWHQAKTWSPGFYGEDVWHKLEAIPLPAKTTVFGDGTGNGRRHPSSGGDGIPRYAGWITEYGYGFDTTRHNKGANVVFVDGHAQWCPRSDFTYWVPGVPNPWPPFNGVLLNSPAGYR